MWHVDKGGADGDQHRPRDDDQQHGERPGEHEDRSLVGPAALQAPADGMQHTEDRQIDGPVESARMVGLKEGPEGVSYSDGDEDDAEDCPDEDHPRGS